MLPTTTIRFNNSQKTLPITYSSQFRSIQPQRIQTNMTSLPIKKQIQQPFNSQNLKEYQIPVKSQQLKSEISFGNNYHSLPPKQNSLTFRQSNEIPPPSARVDQRQSQQFQRPQLVENPQKLLQGTRSRPPKKEEVRTFNVDTTDIQTLKQSEFTGCFHCFYPVSYPTQNKGLC